MTMAVHRLPTAPRRWRWTGSAKADLRRGYKVPVRERYHGCPVGRVRCSMRGLVVDESPFAQLKRCWGPGRPARGGCVHRRPRSLTITDVASAFTFLHNRFRWFHLERSDPRSTVSKEIPP